jgi:hypothetical protein
MRIEPKEKSSFYKREYGILLREKNNEIRHVLTFKHPRLFDDKCPQRLRVLNAQVVDPNDASSDQ